ncbi:MAG TPA: hypothetical protein VED87_11395, partial [Methylocystis sp.]|nr:hypothetical protein [Methylocystis sp.]
VLSRRPGRRAEQEKAITEIAQKYRSLKLIYVQRASLNLESFCDIAPATRTTGGEIDDDNKISIRSM